MRSAHTGLSVALAGAIVVGACYTGPELDPKPYAAGTGRDAGSVGPAGLPCEVAAFVAEQCGACHGETPQGTSQRLTTRGDFLARGVRSETVGQDALLRLRDARSPMPPGALLPESRFSAFAAWVGAGMPAGTCDAAPEDFDTKTVCTSGVVWKGDDDDDDDEDEDDDLVDPALADGDDGSERMNPGRACIDCHTRERKAPRFSVAGTLYPTAHEPDDCFGVDGVSKRARVILTGSDGRDVELAVNEAGNFYSKGAVAMPYRARIVVDGRERAMAAAQTNGDCNTCHSEKGSQGAPGRILLPR